MKAATLTQATGIAQAGARKMTADKYTLKPSSFKSLAGKQFTVINRETGARYTTSIDPKKTFCSCPFFQENKEHRTCKHIERCREEAADVARWEAEAQAREEFATFGKYL